jgi:prophage tail gpP-like protein
MPREDEVAVIVANGQEFRDWESVRVEVPFSREAFAHFIFTAAEREQLPLTDWQKLQLKPDDDVTITLAGNQVIRGYIETRQVAYNAVAHQIELIGKSDTAWGAKSSVKTKDGKFDKMGIIQVAQKVFGEYEIGVRTKGQVNNSPFDPALQVTPGTPAWDFIENAAREKATLLGVDAFGNVLLIGEWDGSPGPQLIEGINIKQCNCIITVQDRFKEVVATGQRKANDQINMQQASEIRKEVTTPERHASMIETPMEHPASEADVQARANFERRMREGSMINATIVVQGWLYNNETIWQPGDLVYINSPMALLNDVLAIQRAIYTQDNQSGTQTTLELVLPWDVNGPGGQILGVGTPTAATRSPPQLPPSTFGGS